MSGEIYHHNWECVTGIQWLEEQGAQDSAHNEQLSSPKRQECHNENLGAYLSYSYCKFEHFYILKSRVYFLCCEPSIHFLGPFFYELQTFCKCRSF